MSAADGEVVIEAAALRKEDDDVQESEGEEPTLATDGGRSPIEVVKTYAASNEVRRRIEVPAEKVDLFNLLDDLRDTEGVRFPETMAADFAVECDDLVDVLDQLDSLDRGLVDANGAGYGMSYVHDLRRAIEVYRDRDPMELVAVGCSSSKHDDECPLPAAERYKGNYWQSKRDYAEATGDAWHIISAKYGLLSPTREITEYNRSVGDLEGVPVDSDQRLPSGESVTTLLDRWALRVYEGLTAWLSQTAGGVDPRDVVLEILLGHAYEDPLRDRGVFDALRARGDVTVSYPFREHEGLTGIGKQMAWLSDRAEEAAPEPVTDGGSSR